MSSSEPAAARDPEAFSGVGEIERYRLRELNARILGAVAEGVHGLDAQGRVIFQNAAASALLGLPPDKAIGCCAHETFHRLRADGRPYPVAECPVHATLRDGVKRTVTDEVFLRSDGTTFPVEYSVAPMRDPGGAVNGVVVTFRDLSERLEMERRFLRAQRMESIGTLAGGIAHDLSNILAPIMLAVELLRQKAPDAEARDMLESVRACAARGAEMVGQILSFARGLEGRRIEIQVRHLMRDLQRILADTLPKNISLRVSAPAGLHTVRGDPTQIHQVLMNLCVNARDALESGGTIELSAENFEVDGAYAAMNEGASAGPHVRIQVRDNGCGIPPDLIERVFDPFFTTKSPDKGTGLGLSTVRTIVRGHGGFVRVRSDPGTGTTFSVFLPVGSAADGQPGEEDPDGALPRGNGETILVVDDEASVRLIARQTLEAFGYRVLTASDGAEATSVYLAEMGRVDLVLMDMMMPTLDGPSAIKVLKQLDPKVRILASSGLADQSKRAAAAALGVRRFLEKPYSAETLLRELAAALAYENPDAPSHR